MASVENETCLICATAYDSFDHSSIELPCHHNFCLTCLLKLQKSKSKKCPTCTISFANVDIKRYCGKRFPTVVMEANSDEAKCDVTKKHASICRTHNLSYSFWCRNCFVFCCNKCIITSHKQCEFCIVEEATDVIKAGMLENITSTKQQVDNSVKDLNKHIEEASKKLSAVAKFRGSVTVVEESMRHYLKTLTDLKSACEKNYNIIEKVTNEVNETAKQPGGVWILSDCDESLKTIQAQVVLPANDKEETLLYHISNSAQVCNKMSYQMILV